MGKETIMSTRKAKFTPVHIQLSSSVLSRLEALCPRQSSYHVFPGFCDVHVHLRQPGFSYKETIASGTRAGAAGGYTALCSMPNLSPPPDCAAALKEQTDLIEQTAVISVFPYGTITKEQKGKELSQMEELAPKVIGFSDDGKGIQTAELMEAAMRKAKALNKMIVAHCEDESLLEGGYIHKGAYALRHGHRGISSESEYRQIQRDLELVRKTGCAYHVCHISTAQSVEAIRKAKKEGLDVSCETAPHYLILTDEDLKEDGRFKMNPPLRGEEDRQALIEGILDGTVDMIATDHAPHSGEEKARGLEKSSFGVVGLETAFAALFTHLVKPGILPLEKLVELMSLNPRKRFGIPLKEEELCVWDTKEAFLVKGEQFVSMGKATPFEGMEFFGKCILTLCQGRAVHQI